MENYTGNTGENRKCDNATTSKRKNIILVAITGTRLHGEHEEKAWYPLSRSCFVYRENNPVCYGQAVKSAPDAPVTVQIDLLIFAQSVIKITYFLWK